MVSIISIVLMHFGVFFVFGALAFEHYFVKTNFFPTLYQTPFPRLFGTVIIVNFIGSTILMIALSWRVMAARKSCRVKAEKDGDTDAEARFAYPKLYAEGFSGPAKIFNCIQRCHQHALEIYPQYLVLSITGGIKFPIVTSLGGVLFLIGRIMYTRRYSKGNVQFDDDSFSLNAIRFSLFIEMTTALATAILIIKGEM